MELIFWESEPTMTMTWKIMAKIMADTKAYCAANGRFWRDFERAKIIIIIIIITLMIIYRY